MLKLTYDLVRLLLYPIFNWVFPIFSRKIRNRIQFENEINSIQYSSFKLENMEANYAFEISSEGELEQVKPIIDYLITRGKLIELIYCSESVDHKCQQIFKNAPGQVRIFRLPIISYNPFKKYKNPQSWLTAKNFFLCRYDFFPELIFYGRQKDVKFNLVWATLKNASLIGIRGKYLNFVYKSFDKILCATENDKKQFAKNFYIQNEKLEKFDFRPWQILQRQSYKLITLSEKFPNFEKFISFMEFFPIEKRIIFGSFWDIEANAFANARNLVNEGYFISIVSHKLDKNHLLKIQDLVFRQCGLKVYEISENMSEHEFNNLINEFQKQPGILMINLKGVLCELYNYFGHAFVGGGHGISVHSLMEPFLANCLVFCGPKVHRSTEYDLIIESHPEKLMIVEKLSELFPLITNNVSLKYNDISNFKDYYAKNFNKILNWFEIK